MVPELKVGDRVKAKGVNVLGNRHSGGIFGPWVAKCELQGSVIKYVVVSCNRKLKSKWNESVDITILSTWSRQSTCMCFIHVEAVEEITVQQMKKQVIVWTIPKAMWKKRW